MSDSATVIRLIRIDFDSMENQLGNAICEKEIAVFAGVKDGEVAHLRCAKYLDALPPTKLYLGWNGEVYPKFTTQKSQTQ